MAWKCRPQTSHTRGLQMGIDQVMTKHIYIALELNIHVFILFIRIFYIALLDLCIWNYEKKANNSRFRL